MLGFNVISTGGAAVLGLIGTGAVAAAIQIHDNRVRKDAIADIRQEQAEFNLEIEEEAREHRLFLDNLYTGFQAAVIEIEKGVSDTPIDQLPQCPDDCRL